MNPNNPYSAPASHTSPPPILPPHISQHLQNLQYPLQLNFKLLALASQATVTDATGRTILFTRQKLLKFKEHVQIWTDASQSSHLADIKANKVIDWSARYQFSDAHGTPLGAVGRRGWRSIWKAHYEAFSSHNESQPAFTIQETNPAAKIFDSILTEIPILGLFSGYFFHPKYQASNNNGTPVMSITKKPAFFEGKFQIDKLASLSPDEELNLFLSFLMLVLLERRRG